MCHMDTVASGKATRDPANIVFTEIRLYRWTAAELRSTGNAYALLPHRFEDDWAVEKDFASERRLYNAIASAKQGLS